MDFYHISRSCCVSLEKICHVIKTCPTSYKGNQHPCSSIPAAQPILVTSCPVPLVKFALSNLPMSHFLCKRVCCRQGSRISLDQDLCRGTTMTDVPLDISRDEWAWCLYHVWLHFIIQRGQWHCGVQEPAFVLFSPWWRMLFHSLLLGADHCKVNIATETETMFRK